MSTKIVDDHDPSVFYTDGWARAGGPDEYDITTSYTSAPGSSATLRFSGSSISVFGTITDIGRGGPPQSAYSVDGGVETHYTAVQRSNVQYKVQFFQSGPLAPGEHTLVVSMTSFNFSILYLDYFQITTGSVSPSLPSSSSSTPLLTTSSPLPSSSAFSRSSTIDATTTSASRALGSSTTDNSPITVTIISSHGLAASAIPSSSPSTGESRSPVGAIIGGILGGLLLMALLSIFVLFRRRKRQHLLLESETPNSNTASTRQITPFTHSRSEPSESSASTPTQTTNNPLIRTPFTKFPPVQASQSRWPGTSLFYAEPSEDASLYPTWPTTTQPDTQTNANASLASEYTSSQHRLSYLSEKGTLVNQVQTGLVGNAFDPRSNQLNDPPPSYNDAR